MNYPGGKKRLSMPNYDIDGRMSVTVLRGFFCFFLSRIGLPLFNGIEKGFLIQIFNKKNYRIKNT